ncbi:MAG: hypothetical protein PHQ23_10540 [Candidatus Wallbacteria bacterium]|nr:hypothetical protein [Candidatus Wallbacteria bacterium]
MIFKNTWIEFFGLDFDAIFCRLQSDEKLRCYLHRLPGRLSALIREEADFRNQGRKVGFVG